MPRWQGKLQRNQIIRRAAEILALDRELRNCHPYQWRMHTLAYRMLTAVAKQGPRPRTVRLVLKRLTVNHANLNTGDVDPREGFLVADVHIGTDDDPEKVCIHLVTDAEQEPPCDSSSDLLEAPAFWTDPQVHAAMSDFLRLEGMACWGAIEGPWHAHDRVGHVVHRAARAALACEKAHQEVLFWNPPVAIVGRNVMGRTVGEVYVEPWRARFEELLQEVKEVEAPAAEPGTKPATLKRQFLNEFECRVP